MTLSKNPDTENLFYAHSIFLIWFFYNHPKFPVQTN